MGRDSVRHRPFTNQRGSVLIATLFIVVAVTLLGLALFEAGIVETHQVAGSEADVRAFYTAQTGLNRAALDVEYDTIGTKSFSLKTSLNTDNTTPSSFYGPTAFGNYGAYIVDAVNSADADKFWLVSTGCIPGPAANPCPAGATAAAQVKALIKRTPTFIPGPDITVPTTTTTPIVTFTWGAFGGQGFSMGGSGGTVASYDSRMAGCTVPCPEGGANFGNNITVGSNSRISFTSSTNVNGHIVNTTNQAANPDVNLGSSVTLNGDVQSGGTIAQNGVTYGVDPTTGTSYNTTPPSNIRPDTASAQVNLQTLPNCGPPYTDLTGKVTQYDASGKVIPATWTYGGTRDCGGCGVSAGSKGGEFVAGGGAIISFTPGTYCLGNVTFSGGSALKIAPNPTDITVITADGQVDFSGGAVANTSHDAQNLQIISTYGNDAQPCGTQPCGETKTGVTLSGGSQAYMTAYAPTTSVVVSGGGAIYGAVETGKLLSFTGGSSIYYDMFLGTPGAHLASTTTTTTTTTTVPGPPIPGPTNWSLVSWQRLACRLGSASWTCK